MITKSLRRILAKNVDPKTGYIIEAHASLAVYAIFYKGRPITIRVVRDGHRLRYKYRTTSFAEIGRAKGFAKRLNKLFVTDQFSVMMLKDGLDVLVSA